jgi:hypothetical protein
MTRGLTMQTPGIAAKKGAYDVSSLKRTSSGPGAVTFSGLRILRKAPAGRQHALEAVDYVLCRDRAAVVELEAGPQLEFPLQPVVGNAVAFRQPRHDLRRIVLVAIEIVVGIQHHRLHRHVVDLVRVEIHRQLKTADESRGIGRLDGPHRHARQQSGRGRAGRESAYLATTKEKKALAAVSGAHWAAPA